MLSSPSSCVFWNRVRPAADVSSRASTMRASLMEVMSNDCDISYPGSHTNHSGSRDIELDTQFPHQCSLDKIRRTWSPFMTITPTPTDGRFDMACCCLLFSSKDVIFLNAQCTIRKYLSPELHKSLLENLVFNNQIEHGKMLSSIQGLRLIAPTKSSWGYFTD